MLSRLFSRTASPEERRIRAWCRKVLGLTPGDLALYRQALRHSSAVPDDRPDLPDNERLEFLGDAVLDTIVGQLLFNSYPDKGEGFLTRMRSKLVSRHQLSILAKHVEIERVMESNVGKNHETSVPGNALEALIGALFLDKGFERTNKAVLHLITRHFDLRTIELEDRDSKSRLLEWGQKKRRRVEFHLTEDNARGGRGKLYTAEARIDGEVRGVGKGNSKKKAEQDAAQQAFRSVRPSKSEGKADRSTEGSAASERSKKTSRAKRGRRVAPKKAAAPRAVLPPHRPAAGEAPADH